MPEADLQVRKDIKDTKDTDAACASRPAAPVLFPESSPAKSRKRRSRDDLAVNPTPDVRALYEAYIAATGRTASAYPLTVAVESKTAQLLRWAGSLERAVAGIRAVGASEWHREHEQDRLCSAAVFRTSDAFLGMVERGERRRLATAPDALVRESGAAASPRRNLAARIRALLFDNDDVIPCSAPIEYRGELLDTDGARQVRRLHHDDDAPRDLPALLAEDFAATPDAELASDADLARKIRERVRVLQPSEARA